MDLLKKIEREQRLVSYEGEDRVIRTSEALESYKRDNPVEPPMKSKLPSLDSHLTGFYPGQLVLISGITGAGKTLLAQTITGSLTEQVAYPLWFSYEVALDDFAGCFDVSYQKYFTMPAKMKGNSVEWIEERIVESKLKFNTKAVFIDHIHFIVPPGKENMSQIIGQVVRQLKLIAIEHKVVVFLIAHLLKLAPDVEPGLGHVRDSSFLEQEADTVLYVYRLPTDKTITVLKIAKNRKRGIVDERIPLIKTGNRYFEHWPDEEAVDKSVKKGSR